MTSQYAFDSRVIACVECGAPLDVGPAGGTSTCEFCGNEQQAKAAAREVPRPASVPAEPERLAQLRAQDTQAVEPPSELAALFVGVDLLPWKIGEALALWNTTRQALADGSNQAMAERLHQVTQGLAAHHQGSGDLLRQRALLESALDVLEAPRHRQAACAALSRAACRAGDLAAAESWLGLCDPRPVDLESDTELRFARAYLDAHHNQPQRILEVLGQSWSDVPIANVRESECVALRAHGWERLGRSDSAVELLSHYLQHTSGYGRLLCTRFVEQHRSLGLCAQSWPIAEGQQQQRGLRMVGVTSGSPGLIWGIILGELGVAAVVAVVLILGGVGWGWGFYAVGLAGLVASAMVVLGRNSARRARRARRLRVHGISAAARIVHASPTNQATNGVPQLMYRVLVLPTSQPPFEAHSVFHADPSLRARFAPGALAVARFDPNDHQLVHLESD